MTLKYEVIKAYRRGERITICGVCYGDAIANPQKEVAHYYEGQWVDMHLPFPVAYFRQMNEKQQSRFDFKRYCMSHKVDLLERRIVELTQEIRKLKRHPAHQK